PATGSISRWSSIPPRTGSRYPTTRPTTKRRRPGTGTRSPGCTRPGWPAADRGIVTEHEARETPPSGKIDITVPHSARIWNYWLGGKDNYTVDRVAGDAFRELYPDITVVARAVRAFLARA